MLISCAVLFGLVCGPLNAQSEADAAPFLTWVQRNSTRADDLRALDKAVAGARVIALSEAAHEANEVLEYRNALFKYLVEKHGVTAIAIESGIVEGVVVDAYVNGAKGSLDDALASGISWTFDRLPQNRDLIRWMRNYNADPAHERKLHFYGFDIPGSAANPDAARGLDTALKATVDYLVKVDPVAADGFSRRLAPIIGQLRFNPAQTDASGYARLSRPDRDTMTAVISDMTSLLARREQVFAAKSSGDAYAWGYRSALNARDVDAWLRNIPPNWKAGQSLAFLSDAADVRDRAQADNLLWLADRANGKEKLFVFAHNYHLSSTSVSVTWWRPAGEQNRPQEVAGTYLRRRLGSQLLTIANIIGHGKIGCSGSQSQVLERAPNATLDGLAGRLGRKDFLVDLRQAPAEVSRWIEQGQPMGRPGDVISPRPGRAFDMLLYFDAVTPACDAASPSTKHGS